MGQEQNRKEQNKRKLPAGSLMWTYRTNTRNWEGINRFISIEEEKEIAKIPIGRKIFHMTVISQPIMRKLDKESARNTKNQKKTLEKGTIQNIQPKTEKERLPTKKKNLIGMVDENENFKTVNIQTILETTKSFGARFIDELKHIGQEVPNKRRLVVQNSNDEEADSIPKSTQTVQIFNQLLLISIEGVEGFSMEITKAYLQRLIFLGREIYIRPPKELKIPKDHSIYVMKHFYGDQRMYLIGNQRI